MKRFDYKSYRETEYNIHITYESNEPLEAPVVITIPKSGMLYQEHLIHPEAFKKPIYGEHVCVPLQQPMRHRVTQKLTAHLVVFVQYVYDSEFDEYLAIEPAEAIAARIVYANYIPASAC